MTWTTPHLKCETRWAGDFWLKTVFHKKGKKKEKKKKNNTKITIKQNAQIYCQKLSTPHFFLKLSWVSNTVLCQFFAKQIVSLYFSFKFGCQICLGKTKISYLFWFKKKKISVNLLLRLARSWLAYLFKMIIRRK